MGIRWVVGAALISALFSPAVVRAEDEWVVNPFYKAWAGFKAGTTATHEETVTVAEGEKDSVPDGKDVKVITYKLLEVTAEKVVVETVVVERAFLRTIESAPTRITFAAKVRKSEVDAVRNETGLKAAAGNVEFQGKTLKGTILSGTFKKKGSEVEFHLWAADTVPGATVKQVRVTKHDDQSSETATIVLKSFRIAE